VTQQGSFELGNCKELKFNSLLHYKQKKIGTSVQSLSSEMFISGTLYKKGKDKIIIQNHNDTCFCLDVQLRLSRTEDTLKGWNWLEKNT